MPLPLLIPLAMGAVALFGTGKAAKAVVVSREADQIGQAAAELAGGAEASLQAAQDRCNQALQAYGEAKIAVIRQDVAAFIALFGRLKNVRLDHNPNLDTLQVGDFSAVALAEMQQTCSLASDVASGTAAGVGAGALTAFGAYGATMMLASAGTGVAISGLSGVAATNATLAWLGGGTLAAGGLGMAGGTMVLGMMVAGPALLVLGNVLGAKAEQKRDEARANLEKANTYKAECSVVEEKLDAILDIATLASDLLAALRARLHAANGALEQTMGRCGEDYATFDEPARGSIQQAVTYAQLVKMVIDTPLLDANGALAEESIGRLHAARACQGQVGS